MISFLKSCIDFMEPPGLIWLALTAACVLHYRRRQWSIFAITGAAWLLLTVTASLPVPHLLMASLEGAWPQVRPSELPECDAIMVLGGSLEPSTREPGGIHFFGGDRLFTAVTLAKLGKGRQLIIGGGRYRGANGRLVFEADSVREWLVRWDLVSIPMTSLGGCADTHDEAVKVAALATQNGWRRVALVTSAYHMRRSQAVFAKAGVTVLPVPCDYQSATMRGLPVRWVTVPNASHLLLFETWMHEIIGWWGYKLRGWI